MDQLSRIGMDTSKRMFQLHGVNQAEQPILRKKLRRAEMVAFFARLAPTEIATQRAARRITGRARWVSLGIR